MREHLSSNEPATLPLSGIAFQLYLQKHNLSPLDVTLTAGVRYMTIWRMMRALPIRRDGGPLPFARIRHQIPNGPRHHIYHQQLRALGSQFEGNVALAGVMVAPRGGLTLVLGRTVLLWLQRWRTHFALQNLNPEGRAQAALVEKLLAERYRGAADARGR